MDKRAYYRELLDGFIVASIPGENGDLEAFCPAHENPGTSKKPSAVINFTPINSTYYPNGMITCFVCLFKGKDASLDNIVRLYKARLESGVQFEKVARKEFVRKLKYKQHKMPDEETLADYREALFSNSERLTELKTKRGLTDETIRKFGIGWINSRDAYCYPVYKAGEGQGQELYALRLYRLEGKVKHSWYNSEGEHTPQLFGIAGLENEPVVILTEGEFDCMLAQQDGFMAVTHNGGAGKFNPDWVLWFRDKVVYVCYDVGVPGNKGRSLVAKMLKDVTKAVYFIDLPGPAETDYTDYRIRDGHSAQEFQALLNASQVEYRNDGDLPMYGKRVSITEGLSSEYVGIPLEMTVQVIGRMETYNIAARISAECTVDKSPKVCEVCPMNKGHLEIDVAKDSEYVQKTIEVRDAEKEKLMLAELGARCKDRITHVGASKSWAVEPVIVGESVEANATTHTLSQTNANITMFNIDSSDSQVNDIYRVVGHSIPNPRNQKAMFMGWVREPTKTNIDQFEMTPETNDILKIFRPEGKETAFDKMGIIAKDLSENVARIMGRTNLGIALDIVWHSALGFYFNGNLESKGWVELIVMGDTRTGKSETAQKLATYYRNGKVFSTEASTRAGIVAAATQPIPGSKAWIVMWGIIPQNDRRLLVLDEAQNLKEMIKEMGSIRSKGVAEKVTASISQSTLARTRLIWMTNPIGKAKIHELSDGAVTAMQEFMPDAEDRSRFDLAIALSSEDVAYEDIKDGVLSKSTQPGYSSFACEQLVLWAWSRQPEHIKISKPVEKYIMDNAGKLIDEYGGDFELVQKENLHVKLARITVAIAIRLFSSDVTGENVIVQNGHVDAAKAFINSSYNDQRFGLGRLSRRKKKDAIKATSMMPEVRNWFIHGSMDGDHNGIAVYRALSQIGGRFSIAEFCVLGNFDHINGKTILSHMSELKLLTLDKGAQEAVLSNQLHELLREMEDEDDEA